MKAQFWAVAVFLTVVLAARGVAQYVPLDIASAFNADVISTESHDAIDKFDSGSASWAAAGLLKKAGVAEGGLPDDGAVAIPNSTPKGFYKLRMPPGANAILLTDPRGDHPKAVTLELRPVERRKYSRLSVLHGGACGDAVVTVTAHYERGPDTTHKLQILEWFALSRTHPLAEGEAVAVTTHVANPGRRIFAERIAGVEVQVDMLSQSFAVDPERVLQAFVFSFESNTPLKNPSPCKFAAGIFAVSALPATGANVVPVAQPTPPSAVVSSPPSPLKPIGILKPLEQRVEVVPFVGEFGTIKFKPQDKEAPNELRAEVSGMELHFSGKKKIDVANVLGRRCGHFGKLTLVPAIAQSGTLKATTRMTLEDVNEFGLVLELVSGDLKPMAQPLVPDAVYEWTAGVRGADFDVEITKQGKYVASLSAEASTVKSFGFYSTARCQGCKVDLTILFNPTK